MLDTERTAAGRFPPGHSGNPAGRPPGSRNKSTLAVEEALAARAGELVGALLHSVHDGKGAALRICFDRLAPLAKGRPVPFALPPLACHDDVVAAGAQVVSGMADGELTPAEAQDIFRVLESFKKLLTPADPAPAADAAASRRPRKPAEACKFPESTAAAGDENAEVPDPAPTSPVTPDPAPPATAEAGREPQEAAETCRSSESEAGAADQNAAVRDPVPTSPTTRDPAPPAAAEASGQPQELAETCRSSDREAAAADQNAEGRDPGPTFRMASEPVPPVAAEASRQPQELAETCNAPESETGAGDEDAEPLDPVPMSPAPPTPSSPVAAATSPAPPTPEAARAPADEAGREQDAGREAASRPSEPGDPPATGTGNSNTADPPPERPIPVRPPPFASSGDPLADRRYDRARQREVAGDLPAAAGLLLDALEIAPGFASAWFAVGDIREKLQDRPGAIAAFRKARDADRDDRHGAGLRLVRLGEVVGGQLMSQGYVRALFDHHAPRFDDELLGHGYRGPELLRQAVETVAGAGVRFERMIDLGCGTGLAAATFAPLCRTAVGIDLSAAMIEIARRKSLYVDLAVADMTERLSQEPTSSADLVVAADVFVYLADLTPVCREAARVLTPGGLLAFSVETHPGGGVILGDKLRFAHAGGHVSAAMDAASLTIRARDPASVRDEAGVAVPGLIVVASPARPPHGWAGRGVTRRRA